MFRLWVCVALVWLSSTVHSFGQTRLDGTYRIQVVADGRDWHDDSSGDKLVSTRYQSNDPNTRFLLEGQPDGSYRLKAKGDGRYLHEDSGGDKLISTRYQVEDDNTRFFFEPQPDGSYRIRVKASGRYLHEDGSNDKLVSTRYQGDDTYTHFKLLAEGGIPTNPAQPPVAEGGSPTNPAQPPAVQAGGGVDQKKALMQALSQQTKAGSYFATIQVPVDLGGFRSNMLAVGNLGRSDPDYRKKHGEEVATDLSGATVLIPRDPAKGRPKDEELKIFKARPTPPYFDDLVLNDALNKAAQFHAEYQASIRTGTHDGPETYDGASMKEFWDRAQHFGYTFRMEGEGCGRGGATDFPEGWMHSDTHFRPWFNLGQDVREVGLGIAKGSDGVWYTCVLSGLGTP